MNDTTGAAWALGCGASDAYVDMVRAGCRRASELAERLEGGDGSAFGEIRDAWVEAELPSQCPDAWNRIWAAVGSSRDADPVMSRGEKRRLRRLPDPVTAYRGCVAGGERGWSWTLDEDIAMDFAGRYLGAPDADGRLCIATVPRDSVVALFTFGGENELIIDPRTLDWHAVEVRRVS